MVCDCKVVLYFVFVDWLVKGIDVCCALPFCLLMSPIVRGFLSVLLSTLRALANSKRDYSGMGRR
jgi:hypothetical protein